MTTIHVVTQITENPNGEPEVETWAFTSGDKAQDTALALVTANERDWLKWSNNRDAPDAAEPPDRIVRYHAVELA